LKVGNPESWRITIDLNISSRLQIRINRKIVGGANYAPGKLLLLHDRHPAKWQRILNQRPCGKTDAVKKSHRLPTHE
jgi:hypothetical protein